MLIVSKRILVRHEWMVRTYAPAERNTICTVSGILYLNTQLLSNDPVVSTVTWSAHRRMGTCGRARRGKIVFGRRSRKVGRAWRAMKSIWENVSAEPSDERVQYSAKLAVGLGNGPMRGFIRRSSSYVQTFLGKLKRVR